MHGSLSRATAPVWVFTAVAAVWAPLAVRAYAQGLTVTNCGCFGIYVPQRLTWFVQTAAGGGRGPRAPLPYPARHRRVDADKDARSAGSVARSIYMTVMHL